MIYEEYLQDLRAARFHPRAWRRYVQLAFARIRLEVAANPGAARSFLVLGMVLFGITFAGCLALALLADLGTARRVLLWTGAWVMLIIAILLANLEQLRTPAGYRLSAVNLPIAISTARFALVPALAIFIAAGMHRTALWFYVLLSLSDVLDGWLARRTRQVTAMGRLMDPMVDLVFFLGVMTALYSAGRVSGAILALALVRYGGLILGGSLLRLTRGPVRIHSTVPGKASGLLIGLLIGFLLLLPAYGAGPISSRLAPLAEDALGVLFAAGIVHMAILGWVDWRHAGESAADLRRQGRPLRCDKRPMLFELTPLLDPFPQRFDLLRRERFARIGRRHADVRVVASDPGDQLALVRLARGDHGFRAPQVACIRPDIKPQLGLPLTGIRPVALETIVRQNRPYVAREIELAARSAQCR